MLLAVLAATIVGVTVGGLLATVLSRRTVDSAHATPVGPSASEATGSSVRDAVDRLEIGVVMFDSAGDVTFSNSAARVMNGTHAGLIVNDHLSQVVKRVRTGGAWSREIVLHGPPRQIIAIEAKPLPRGGIVATIQDVSARALVDAMRKDFVANISHELKTPVGAIAVLAETIADERDPTVTSNLSARLVDEAHRAIRTIDDLLELSRIETKVPADDCVDLATIVDLAIERGKASALGRDIEITALDPGDPIHVRGDRRQLESALGNLVENAVKYSHDGGAVQVRVRVDEPWIELMVADQGVGIPARDLDRVFERFYRVDKARARDTGGTGLGLSIVRHVAANHGGDVAVQSAEGEGSTFVVRLPARLLVTSADSERKPLAAAREDGRE
ncbi:MAG: two-component sensor histidine kinase [Ilumatobacter sp.]|nr:two-component sensor histidine kinase [Ilumatobacter sp.]